MKTIADKHRDAAIFYINAAIQSLSEITINQCDEYTIEYKDKLKNAMGDLIRMLDDLK